jgi:adenylate kinase family enzyme
MQKIIVIGCPGSGKSTFSRKLSKITNIPLYHLDMLFWNADKTTVEKSVFLERLGEALKKDSWIIDGNYISTMERRIIECDTVIFLDYPVDICLLGIEKRNGTVRSDMPWVETEADPEFLEFIKNFSADIKPKIMALLEKYRDKNIFIFKTRTDADAFLQNYIAKL